MGRAEHTGPGPPVQPPELQYEDVQTRGLRFRVATAGQGKRLALLLHGFPECAYSWRHQIPLLAELGYLVWAPDLRGYGGSDRPLGVAEYALEKLEQDVADLIAAAGAEEVLLVGHDWGAVIAWSYAMHGTRPIDRLVIMNVPHPACFERGLRRPRQLLRSWYIFFFQLPGLPERALSAAGYRAIDRAFRGMAVDESRFPDEVLQVYREHAAIPGATTAMINYYRAAARGAGRQRSRGMPTIHVPTLMLWGEQDAALGKELTFGTAEYVEDLTLRYLPGVSHWVQQEAPETVNAMLRAWLSGEPVPEA